MFVAILKSMFVKVPKHLDVLRVNGFFYLLPWDSPNLNQYKSPFGKNRFWFTCCKHPQKKFGYITQILSASKLMQKTPSGNPLYLAPLRFLSWEFQA